MFEDILGKYTPKSFEDEYELMEDDHEKYNKTSPTAASMGKSPSPPKRVWSTGNRPKSLWRT